MAVCIGDVVATAAQDSSEVNRHLSTSRLFTSASSRARCRRPEQTSSTPSKSSASSAVPSLLSTQSTELQQKTPTRISATCSFLDRALGPDRSHMEIDLPIEEFLHQHELCVLKARGDSYTPGASRHGYRSTTSSSKSLLSMMSTQQCIKMLVLTVGNWNATSRTETTC